MGKLIIWLPKYLEEMSVVLLNLCLVVHPDFHPEAFLLTVATHGIPIVPFIDLSVLLFPGLNFDMI